MILKEAEAGDAVAVLGQMNLNLNLNLATWFGAPVRERQGLFPSRRDCRVTSRHVLQYFSCHRPPRRLARLRAASEMRRVYRDVKGFAGVRKTDDPRPLAAEGRPALAAATSRVSARSSRDPFGQVRR